MKSFKIQNTCILIAIILIDAVAYLLMGQLLMGGRLSISTETLLSTIIYLWHGVNLILFGYLIFLMAKTLKNRKMLQIAKNNKK